MVLEVRNISKSFGKKRILTDVSFGVDRGEILGFIGPNGAGKTTAIKIILGLLSADGGTVYINGKNIAENHDEALRSVGAIIESPELYPYLSGRENLMQYARLYSLPAARVDECLREVGLYDHRNTKLGKYSLGMRQRIGLAQAMLHLPSLYVLDEPTNGLDPSGVKDLRETLVRLASQAAAVLVSSHMLSELEQFCTKAAIIEHGRIVDIKTLSGTSPAAADEKEEYIFCAADNALAAEELSLLGCNCVSGEAYVTAAIPRADVPAAVRAVSAKTDLYEVYRRKKSLEDTYLEATHGKI